MNTTIFDKLNELNRLFKKMNKDNKPQVKTNSTIADGEYSVTIVSTKLIESKNGIPQYLWTLRIDEGEYEECILNHRNTLTNTEKTIDQLIKDFKKCQVTLSSLIELKNEEISKALEGKRLLVKVENNQDFYNTFFMKGL